MTGEIAAAPMTRHRPIFNRGRAFTDRDHVRDLTMGTTFLSCLFGTTDRALGSKMLKQLFLKHAAGLNEQALINRLVRHAIDLIVRIRLCKPA